MQSTACAITWSYATHRHCIELQFIPWFRGVTSARAPAGDPATTCSVPYCLASLDSCGSWIIAMAKMATGIVERRRRLCAFAISLSLILLYTAVRVLALEIIILINKKLFSVPLVNRSLLREISNRVHVHLLASLAAFISRWYPLRLLFLRWATFWKRKFIKPVENGRNTAGSWYSNLGDSPYSLDHLLCWINTSSCSTTFAVGQESRPGASRRQVGDQMK